MPKKPPYIKKTPEDKKKEIERLTNQAAKNLQNYTSDEEHLKEYLKFTSQFYNYSSKNQNLMHSQYEGAKAVASAKSWNEKHGLYIRKGQKAMRIFAPTKYTLYKINGVEKSYSSLTVEEKKQVKEGLHDKKEMTGFVLVPVFDITQTTAKVEDYPKYYPNRPFNFEYNGDDLNKLKEAMLDNAKRNDISVATEEVMEGSERGYFSPTYNHIGLADNITETELIAVLNHEMAHAILHNNNEMKEQISSRPVKELEAEMTAFVVSNYYGLDSSEYSARYTQSWSMRLKETEDIEKIFENVNKASEKLITGINQSLEKQELQKEKLNDNGHEHQAEKSSPSIEIIGIKDNKQVGKIYFKDFDNEIAFRRNHDSYLVVDNKEGQQLLIHRKDFEKRYDDSLNETPIKSLKEVMGQSEDTDAEKILKTLEVEENKRNINKNNNFELEIE